MQSKWIEDFVSPVTQEPLMLSRAEGDGAEVKSGILANDDSRFEILGGIPRFVTSSYLTDDRESHSGDERTSRELQTAHSFGRLWRHESYMPKPDQSEAVRQSLSEQLEAMVGIPVRAESFDDLVEPGMKVLNAGCGTGWTETLFKTPEARRYAVDLSLAVESAYEATRELDNTIVAQADISALPFRDGFFDLIISNGVIHHTSDPSGNFARLVNKLKPGGMIGIYVYRRKPYLRELADMAIRTKSTDMSFEDCQKFAAQMTALGESLAAIKEPLELSEDIPLL
ncbi:MAG: class I SAM-dependent methyltransferase, partial [Deltaproteobacteria bacterium]|nr:class I SAM-dependent methyltransferase [Deltaproteobacteria bacterium]